MRKWHTFAIAKAVAVPGPPWIGMRYRAVITLLRINGSIRMAARRCCPVAWRRIIIKALRKPGTAAQMAI